MNNTGRGAAYRQHLKKNPPKEKIYDVPMPSGFVWKARKFPIEQWTILGKVPKVFTGKIANSLSKVGKLDINAVSKTVTPNEAEDMILFVRAIAYYSAVSPSISLDPQTDDEIAPEEIAPEDFSYLLEWAVTPEGKEVEGLHKFRRKP